MRAIAVGFIQKEMTILEAWCWTTSWWVISPSGSPRYFLLRYKQLGYDIPGILDTTKLYSILIAWILTEYVLGYDSVLFILRVTWFCTSAFVDTNHYSMIHPHSNVGPPWHLVTSFFPGASCLAENNEYIWIPGCWFGTVFNICYFSIHWE